MRVVIKYAHSGAANYISHLDMQRTFARAIRRAQLPALYTKGYNPHMIMSFASPLSLGYGTIGDYLEIELPDGEDISHAAEELNHVLTEDIHVLEVFAIKDSKKKLMAMNHSAVYHVTFALENECKYDKIYEAADFLLAQESYIVVDRKKRERDIVAMILSMERAQGGGLVMQLQNSSQGALNPRVVANALLDIAELDGAYEVLRVDCYANTGDRVISFSELERLQV